VRSLECGVDRCLLIDCWRCGGGRQCPDFLDIGNGLRRGGEDRFQDRDQFLRERPLCFSYFGIAVEKAAMAVRAADTVPLLSIAR
jgi:hypothetical protein